MDERVPLSASRSSQASTSRPSVSHEADQTDWLSLGTPKSQDWVLQCLAIAACLVTLGLVLATRQWEAQSAGILELRIPSQRLQSAGKEDGQEIHVDGHMNGQVNGQVQDGHLHDFSHVQVSPEVIQSSGQNGCPGAQGAFPGIPGSSLTSAPQVQEFRELMNCVSTQGSWVRDTTPRLLPWRYGLDVPNYLGCDKRHIQGGGISHANADRVAQQKDPDPGGWRVRETLQYVWRVDAGRCRGLDDGVTLDPGTFRPAELCQVLGAGAEDGGSNSSTFRKIVVVGDSLQSQMAVSLASLFQLGHVDVDNPGALAMGALAALDMPCTQAVKDGAKGLYSPLQAQVKFCFGRQVCDNSAATEERQHGAVQLLFMRSDHLELGSQALPDEGPGGNREVHMPWLSELTSGVPREKERGGRENGTEETPREDGDAQQQSPGQYRRLSPIVVFNTGAHFREDSKFTATVCDALVETRRQCPECLIVFRSTPGGHPDCDKYMGPSRDRVHSNNSWWNRFSWDKVVEQTQHARALVESVGGVFLDVEPMTALRPDGHVARLPKGALDCLHYCAPGPMDLWSLLLTFALRKLL